jgi:hydrogenase nickel incorporation protein HypB
MCTTCGCNEGAKSTLTNPETGQSVPVHHHEHHHPGHGHPHPHGPDAFEGKIISLEEEILAKNNALAERNRQQFQERNILALNLLSAPGAGKTTLLERTLTDLDREFVFQVIEGDQATTRDADRIRATGCRVVQINTGSGCHLEADMLARGMEELNPSDQSVVMIENVGNLVCPALFDLGERAKVVILSVTEGEDKPLKYPHMFRAADLLILNKVDLLPHVSFDVEACLENIRQVNPEAKVLQLSASRGEGLDPWYQWIRERATMSERNASIDSNWP